MSGHVHRDDFGSRLGMWLFLVTEVLFFGGALMAYSIYRSWYPDAFASASHHLDITLGALNTAVLIVSSLTMAMAVYYSQLGDNTKVIIFLTVTLILCFAFLGIKYVEYSTKIHDHLFPAFTTFHPTTTGPHGIPEELQQPVRIFLWIYFMMTGLHALHMIIGLGIMTWMYIWVANGTIDKDYTNPIEISGLYWHFVDIVWIFLFPLLYLIGRHGTGAH